jgi:6-phosphogluconolactonase
MIKKKVKMFEKFHNPESLNLRAAALFIQIANKSIKEKGRFTVALTGGSSPQGLYTLLAEEGNRRKIDWSKVFIFWGDERWVPLNNKLSNAGAAIRDLIQKLPIPTHQVFPMYSENESPEKFAETYTSFLEKHLEDSKHFDLILLGMGEDGHTASLFPGESVLDEKDKKVVAYFLKSQDLYRITLTASIINDAKSIIFLVFGDKKRDALYQVLKGDQSYLRFPSKLIKPHSGNIYWLIDELAASKLEKH